ncbi:MAG: GNAT family N-acetyltransferase [Lachnospiraceae bacterium]|nr:GNAT family N-acetyltransferase [Lachnospiraceae bacterium]
MIREIKVNEIKECVEVIRKSFQTVADELGFTPENAPRFTAYATDEEKLGAQFMDENHPMFGYFSKERLIGYYSLTLQGGKTCELNNLCVLPEFRHNGIGAELLDHAFETGISLGNKLMRIGIVEENKVLRAWYEKHGFEHCGEMKLPFLPFTVGFMMKRLVEAKPWDESEKGLFRYETHLHTVEGSACGLTPGREYPAIFRKRGYDGIFITDHFFHGNTRPSRELPWPEYVDAYMKGYEEAKKAGDEIGFKVFFGIEENFDGDEFLLYGIDRDFLLAHPEIPHWTREDMIKAVHEAGGAVMQAHPFRDRDYIKKIHLYAEDIEGIEGINTANTANDNLAALCYALHYGLMIQAGSDTHFKMNIGEDNAGVLFEEPITSELDYAGRLLRHERPRIFFPEDFFGGMEGIKVKLPVEIRRNGAWEELSEKEYVSWFHEAGATAGEEGSQPEGLVSKIVKELGAK